MAPFTIIGLGELLWDRLPAGKKLGGAPANFAYHASLLGDRSFVVTRVGTDELGNEALELLRSNGLDVSHIQRDSVHPTGTVDVQVDAIGHANYIFADNVAWDYLEMNEDMKALAASADAVCFGSLAQRNLVSQETILAFIRSLPEKTLRIFDVNLRANFYTTESIDASLKMCDMLKLNEDELPKLAELLSIPWTDEKDVLEKLRERYNLDLMCYTRSSRGAYFVSATECCDHPGYRVQVADTIGAGDAFTAAVAHHYLAGDPLSVIAERASRRGAWVATQAGAMPDGSSYDDSFFSSSHG